ncbi:MAG TPA: CAP domain-containing protein [Pyrinomonadaceae bacterium]|nr:CAP domain-containing protein [Pyrinomonadaceae bacterium]
MKRRIPYLLAPLAVVLLVLIVVRLHLPARVVGLSQRALRASIGREPVPPKVDYLSAAELAMLNEINRARANPQQYAALVEQLKQTATGKQIKVGPKTITLQEGTGVLDEAISFLRAAQPLPPLSAAKGMSLGARDHARDLGLSGNTGHKGSDGSLPEQRVGRYGEWQTTIGENIAYNSGDAREAVVGMIIDDGIPSRGHRKNIFSSDFRVAGVAIGPPSSYGLMCVITYAGGYADKGATTASLR